MSVNKPEYVYCSMNIQEQEHEKLTWMQRNCKKVMTNDASLVE